MFKKILYDIAVIVCIAIVIIPIALWASLVAMLYALKTLPKELIAISDKYYYD